MFYSIYSRYQFLGINFLYTSLLIILSILISFLLIKKIKLGSYISSYSSYKEIPNVYIILILFIEALYFGGFPILKYIGFESAPSYQEFGFKGFHGLVVAMILYNQFVLLSNNRLKKLSIYVKK